jgi:hypothetical protein
MRLLPLSLVDFGVGAFASPLPAFGPSMRTLSSLLGYIQTRFRLLFGDLRLFCLYFFY